MRLRAVCGSLPRSYLADVTSDWRSPACGVLPAQLVSGEQFSCALLDTTDIKCWGRNTHGQLFQGSYSNLGDQPDEMGRDLPSITKQPGWHVCC